jgi:hypothetical protein
VTEEKLILTPLNDGTGRYVVYEDYKAIPVGFITDGGSIPRFLWRVIGHPFEGEYIARYVEHDHDYQTGRIPRKDADIKLRNGLEIDGMGWIKRNLVYCGVRMFGGQYYNKQKRKTDNE